MNDSKLTKKITASDNRIKALEKQIVYYKEIVETVREPFVILDNELNVVTANMAFYRKFKVKKKDTEGKQIYELGNNQWDAPELRMLLENILPKHRILNNYAVSHDFPTLGPRTMFVNARQVDSKQLILMAIEDVTEQLKLKADSLEITKNLIEQRNQLQEFNDNKDEFIALASHQLRTPATIVKQYVGLLTEGYVGKLSKKQLASLEVAYSNNERQLEIIEDLLRVARVDANKVYLDKSLCDVVTQIQEVISRQSSMFKNRDQTVSFKIPRKEMIANIDLGLMLMVLENILDNAGKYSGKDDVITVTVSQTGDNTIISIKDSGIGISKVDQKKLFKKFSRIDNPNALSVSGTGLGLYWAKKILDLHSGDITVSSKLGKGTTFKIIAPTN